MSNCASQWKWYVCSLAEGHEGLHQDWDGENPEDGPLLAEWDYIITPKQALDLMEPVTYTKADMARAWDRGFREGVIDQAVYEKLEPDQEHAIIVNPYK